MNSRVRVLVVDDSPFFQRRISEALSTEPSIEVVGTAGDGLAAVQAARTLRPDVVTMDVEMPVLDGIGAVRRIMAETPSRILMFSALTHDGAQATLDALEAGAVDFLPKQFERHRGRVENLGRVLPQRVLALARRGPGKMTPGHGVAGHRSPDTGSHRRHFRLVVIGASTGGPVAIQQVISRLPADFPLPLLIVVHMPAAFTPAYAERLDAQCRIRVKEAQDGDPLRPGQAYLAPGGRQMLLERRGAGAVVRIRESAPGQTYKPSVDMSLGSAARVWPDAVLAILLTGMGADGRQGARLLKQGGSSVWSQDEASCVVYGMPQAVEKAGLSDQVLPLSEIGPQLGRIG
ncbi:MAG TPA: chemotaxis response regulator protein-glutamate methylesterase [Sedimenticola sp.]|nr:chemotaxis response regulator protein-glutamate methylesterase [Sedimenticola sp.]